MKGNRRTRTPPKQAGIRDKDGEQMPFKVGDVFALWGEHFEVMRIKPLRGEVVVQRTDKPLRGGVTADTQVTDFDVGLMGQAVSGQIDAGGIVRVPDERMISLAETEALKKRMDGKPIVLDGKPIEGFSESEGWYISVKENWGSGPSKHFEVPQAICQYILQLEAYIAYPDDSKLLSTYPRLASENAIMTQAEQDEEARL